MPIYEYRCESCGHELDVIQKVSDDALTECPSCGAHALKKLVSAPSFRLKGSGWYETDFKKDNRRNLADAGDKPADGDKKSDKAAVGKADGGGKDSAGKAAKDTSSAKPSSSGSKTSNG